MQPGASLCVMRLRLGPYCCEVATIRVGTLLHGWIDMQTTPTLRGCLLGNRSTEESKTRAAPPFVQALVDSKSALWPSEMSTLKRNSAACVAKEVNEERLSVPQNQRGTDWGCPSARTVVSRAIFSFRSRFSARLLTLFVASNALLLSLLGLCPVSFTGGGRALPQSL